MTAVILEFDLSKRKKKQELFIQLTYFDYLEWWLRFWGIHL
jgi:hypothetical protein